jgi:hypothetical protein
MKKETKLDILFGISILFFSIGVIVFANSNAGSILNHTVEININIALSGILIALAALALFIFGKYFIENYKRWN